MNVFQWLSLFLAAAFLLLAFLSIKVLDQRNHARHTAALADDAYIAMRRRVEELEDEKTKAEQVRRQDAAKLGELEAAKDLFGQTRCQLLDMRRAFDELRAARNVAWIRPAKRMPDHEVKRAFAVASEAPLWVAFNQEIDDWLQGLFDEVSKPPSATLSEAQRLHMAGGIEEIRELQKKLLELHATAHKGDADLDDEQTKKGVAA